MTACGGLEHIFEKPLPESPTLLESLSPWKQIKSTNPIHHHSSFTEIFGELHVKENHPPDSSSSPSSSTTSSPSPKSCLSTASNPPTSTIDIPNDNHKNENLNIHQEKKREYRGHSDSLSSMNLDSLFFCTEGLGSESFDDAEDLIKNDDDRNQDERSSRFTRNTPLESGVHWGACRRSRSLSMGEFPPPISCIGRSGKPWVSFKSFREDGRFILKEIRIPTQELLHACREDGRLKLQFIQADDDEILEGGEGNNEDAIVKYDGDNLGA